MADGLASIRPLVVSTAFDSSATLAATRQVSATVTAYGNLEGVLRGCDATAALAPRFGRLVSSAQAMLGKAFAAAITDSQTQRDVAVSLFGLLREDLAISQANKAVADSLSMTDEIAQIQDGGAQPLSSLPRLATPVPPQTPTPRASPRPTATVGSGGSGSSSSYRTASQYLNSTGLTYTMINQAVSNLWGFGVSGPGVTKEEVAANEAGARLVYTPTVHQIASQLAFISNHPLRCLRDAYSPDKTLAVAWRTAFESYIYPEPYTPEGRQATYAWQDRLAATNAFISNLSRYVSDC
jgi:hypothetical protein